MRVVVAALLAAGLSACASNASFIPRPTDGYAALRARETVLLPKGAIGGDLVLPAGSVLVADRQLPDGELLFCGDVGFRDAIMGMSTRKLHLCFAKRGADFVANPDRGGGAHTASMIPPGAIEEFRLR